MFRDGLEYIIIVATIALMSRTSLSSSLSIGLSYLTPTKLLQPEYFTACCNNFDVVEPQQKIIYPQSINILEEAWLADIITHHTTIFLRKVAGQTESFAET